MQLKWLGCLLLLAVAVGYGVIQTAKLQKTRRRLMAWTTLLHYVRGQISCFALPLSEILARAPREVVEPLKPTHGQADDFAALCRTSAATLTGESARILRELAEEIGTIWRQEQLERLQVYAAAMEKEKNAFLAALPGRVRLHSTLSVCASLAVILLIW